MRPPARSVPSDPLRARGRVSLGRYLRDVLLLALVLAGALLLYHRKVENDRRVEALGREAKALLVRDEPGPLAEAESKLLAMVASRDEHPYAVSALAELYLLRWLDWGLEADAAKAREWVGRANALAAPINERFGAAVLGLVAEGRPAEAERYAVELGKTVGSTHALHGLGRALRAQGKLDPARQALAKAADGEWRSPRFACDAGDLYLESGDAANALAFYTKAVEANSEHARAQVGRARALIARGQRLADCDRVLAELLRRPAAQLPPRTKALALTAVAELRLAEGKPEGALAAADEAVATYPALGWGHHARGRALAARRGPEAAAALAKAVEVDPVVPQLYFAGAAALAEAGELEGARRLMERYRRALPEDERYHLAFGQLLARGQQPEEALAQFDKALALDRFSAPAHLAKGALLLQSRREPEARKELELVLQIQEIYPEAYVQLGELHFAARRWSDGCRHFAEALVQMRGQQQPPAKLAELRERVERRLRKEQPALAGPWMEETKGLVE